MSAAASLPDDDRSVVAGPGPTGSGLSGPGPSGPALSGPALSGPALTNLVLARAKLDRSAHLRADQAWLAAAWADPRSRVLVVEHGRALCDMGREQVRLVFVSPPQAPEGVQFLLGVDDDGVAYFGVAGPLAEPPRETVRAVPLREAGPLLSDRDAGLLTHAVALANWHETFTHCPRCGAVTAPISSGHARKCPVDGSEHFPRVDPAMIVLVTERCRSLPAGS